jgi:hypothetical protein
LKLLQKAQALQDELLPIARRGAALFTVLKSLGSVDSYETYKLDQYMHIFSSTISSGETNPTDDLDADDTDKLDEALVRRKLQIFYNSSALM